jgi:hypothetical protein
VTFTTPDREIYAAHSAVECEGVASTRQIADHLGLPAVLVAPRLVAMQRRGLVAKSAERSWDDTADWTLTRAGCAAAAVGRRLAA